MMGAAIVNAVLLLVCAFLLAVVSDLHDENKKLKLNIESLDAYRETLTSKLNETEKALRAAKAA